jgi:hypothetical protein
MAQVGAIYLGGPNEAPPEIIMEINDLRKRKEESRKQKVEISGWFSITHRPFAPRLRPSPRLGRTTRRTSQQPGGPRTLNPYFKEHAHKCLIFHTTIVRWEYNKKNSKMFGQGGKNQIPIERQTFAVEVGGHAAIDGPFDGTGGNTPYRP